MTPRPTWSQDRLFEPPPASYSRLSLALTVHLDGPSGRCEVWSTISDTTTGEQLACWSSPAGTLDAAPAIASELAADLVRTAMRDLSPF